MKVVGLTGSIGMGKSTTGAMFAAEGVPVYDADAAVHALYSPGGAAVEPVGGAFPGTVRDGAIDREALSAQVLGRPEALKTLEELVHPLANATRAEFFGRAAAQSADLVVLDIPLLFETGGDKRVDAVVVVSAPFDIQRARVMSRPGMTEEKLAAILARQMPDDEKRARADYVIDTGGDLDSTRARVRQVIAALRTAKA